MARKKMGKRCHHHPKTVLRLPDLDQPKSAVLDSLSSAYAQRGYRHATDEFIEWYCAEAAITKIESASEMTTPVPCSLPQDLVHGLSLGQFIHQLVQVTDLLHEPILDLLHPITADHAGDLRDVRVDEWRAGEESLEVDLFVDLLLQRLFIVAREPVDDGMHLLLRTTLLLRLGDVMRVDAGERHSEYSRVVHGLVGPRS